MTRRLQLILGALVITLLAILPILAQQGAKAQPIRARAHLLVTVPLYMNWSNAGASR